MVRCLLEEFLEKVRNKGHILEILPPYSLGCCMKTEDESSYFVIGKDRMEIVASYDSLDIKIEGSSDVIKNLLSGSIKLTDKKIVFSGSFRQYLLVDSLLFLAKDSSL